MLGSQEVAYTPHYSDIVHPTVVLRSRLNCLIRQLVYLQLFKMDVKIEDILQTLTLEEKVSLLAGKDFWQTVPVPEKGVPPIKVR